jgi:hypothetical protein
VTLPLGGRLLVVQEVLPAGDTPSFGKLLDLQMLLIGGRERTEGEYRTLYEAAGFDLTRVIPTPAPLHVMEGIARVNLLLTERHQCGRSLDPEIEGGQGSRLSPMMDTASHNCSWGWLRILTDALFRSISDSRIGVPRPTPYPVAGVELLLLVCTGPAYVSARGLLPSWSCTDSQAASQSRRCRVIASGLARTQPGLRQAWMRTKGCPDTEEVTGSNPVSSTKNALVSHPFCDLAGACGVCVG